MKRAGINLDRVRPERAAARRLSLGKTVTMIVSIAPGDKARLKAEAKRRGYSLSLYLNLILVRQEKSPL